MPTRNEFHSTCDDPEYEVERAVQVSVDCVHQATSGYTAGVRKTGTTPIIIKSSWWIE